MKNHLRLLSTLIALCLFMVSVPLCTALADTSWVSAYTTLLKQQRTKRAVSLIDLNSDGTPELCVLSSNAAGESHLSFYGASGSPLNLDLPGFPVKNVKSVAMTVRKDGINPCLLVDLTTTTSTRVRVGVTYLGNSMTALINLKQVKSGNAFSYHVDGSSASKATYDKALSNFNDNYKKVGNAPTKTISKADKPAAIGTRFNSLVKSYNAFATAKSVKLSQTKFGLKAGKTLQLRATVSPASAVGDIITWSSSDESVATVTNGMVRALSEGVTQVIATTKSGKSAKCKITVKGAAVSGVMLDEPALTLTVGEGYKLTATIQPTGANETLKWSTGNAKIATVSQNGEVVARSKGKVTITVKSQSGKTAKCKIVVNTTPAMIVDMSQHEYSTKIDWKLVKQNVDLLILRCGVTRTGTAPIGVGKDDKFAYYAQKCQEFGIPFGVYFYGKCSDAETAKKEAQMTWDVASPFKPLFYVYDVEESRLNKTLIETYMKTLQSLGAKKTGYYIAHHLYSKFKLDTNLVDFIWIPHYGANTGSVNSSPSYPCDLHQFTSRGRIPGLVGDQDLNRLMGGKSLAWFLSRA